jgi:hypothetical protein
MVAPASRAAAAEIIPSPWPLSVFPGPNAIKKKPTVPTAATTPANVAGTKALGSVVPEICARRALFSLMGGSTSVVEEKFSLRDVRACRRVRSAQKAVANPSARAHVQSALTSGSSPRTCPHPVNERLSQRPKHRVVAVVHSHIPRGGPKPRLSRRASRLAISVQQT